MDSSLEKEKEMYDGESVVKSGQTLTERLGKRAPTLGICQFRCSSHIHSNSRSGGTELFFFLLFLVPPFSLEEL